MNKKTIRKPAVTHFVTLLCLFYFLPFAAWSQSAENQKEARRVFDIVYNKVYGPQGSTLHYDVNIVGILKTNGTIWIKGKKSRFQETRYLSWNNGVTDYWVDMKKKTVTEYDANAPRSDKYMSKFTFNLEDYTYSIDKSPQYYYVITLNAKKDVKGIKHLKAIIEKDTYAPKSLKIKVLWFWTTVKITNFRSGGISDHIFEFPKDRYKEYKFEKGK